MKRRYVVLTEPEAEIEIEGVLRWWEQRNPLRANAIVDEIEKAILFLGRFPEGGGRIELRGKWSETIRHLILDKIRYVLFYEVVPETQRVYLLALRHEKQRPPRLKRRFKLRR